MPICNSFDLNRGNLEVIAKAKIMTKQSDKPTNTDQTTFWEQLRDVQPVVNPEPRLLKFLLLKNNPAPEHPTR